MSSILNVDVINTSKGGSLASQATLPSSFWLNGSLVPVSGTASISAIAEAPQAGIHRTILVEGAFQLVSSANFLVAGGTQTVTVGSLIEVYSITTTSFFLKVIDKDLKGGGATGGTDNYAFWENDKIISSNYTVTSGKNAGTFGPISVNTGITVTVPTGSVWIVI